MARYWVGGTGNSNDTAHWSASSGGAGGAALPTAADDVIFDGSSGSGTATINAAFACRSLASSGTSVATLVHNASITISVGDASGGSFDLSGFTTYTKGSASSSAVSFVSTAAGNTIKLGGKVLGTTTINGAGGSWTLQDAYTANSLTLTNGMLSVGSANVSLASFLTAAGVKTLNMGSGTWSLTGTGTVWNVSATTFTLNAQTSTIAITDTSAATKTFASVSKTYNVISFTGTAAGVLSITGAPTIATLNASGAAKTVRFTAGNAYTIANFNGVVGTAGNLVTLDTTAAGTFATLVKQGGGNVVTDYLAVKDIHATGGAWYAGTHSTDTSGNTGWRFKAPPKTSLLVAGVWTYEPVQQKTGGSFAEKPVTVL